MSAYTSNSFSHQIHQQGSNGGVENHRDPLSQQHGVPMPQQYQYEPPPQQHHQSYEEQENSPAGQIIDDGPKVNRLRKACDSCSIRKVKCDESGPPCRACAALDIPCTFDRPSRRRGPPNRHAEAMKRRRVDSPAALTSSPHNVAATLASFSSHAVLSAESICPFSTLELLVDDFFTYIHPLVPFPHEPSFRAAFKHREDLNNPAFLALLASMVGCLVASFPRKPRLHLKAQHRDKLFPNSLSLVERCHKVAVEARGAGYLDKDLTVYDAATSYFLGLAAAYTIQWRQCRLYFAETLTIARAIGVHRLRDPTVYAVGDLPAIMGHDGPSVEGQAGEPIDYIRQEIGRRIFWVMFVGVRSMQQLGASFAELTILPPTPNDPYPPLPLEVDDQYIYVSHVDNQPPGVISEITGFNLGVQVYLTCVPLTTMEMAYGIGEVFDWNRQKRVIEECLRAVKRSLDNIPAELMLKPSSRPGEFEQSIPVAESREYFPPMHDFPGARRGGDNDPRNGDSSIKPDVKRNLQYEIQKANVYASQLGTRSYLVEKYWNLFDAHNASASARENGTSNNSSVTSSPGVMASGLDGILRNSLGGVAPGQFDVVENHMNSERENIVKDLLQVLSSISQVNMEPNGSSFINKIRQIASTLLDDPRNRKGPLALKAEEYLGRFLDVLMKLERISPSHNYGERAGTDEEEEEELRHWADLREFQERFARNGGFLSEL